jgi:hypothetical protein
MERERLGRGDHGVITRALPATIAQLDALVWTDRDFGAKLWESTEDWGMCRPSQPVSGIHITIRGAASRPAPVLVENVRVFAHAPQWTSGPLPSSGMRHLGRRSRTRMNQR